MAWKTPEEPTPLRVVLVTFLFWLAVAVGIGLVGGQVAANLFGPHA